ncbi:MAG: transglycosylase SLT domain-containing protein, partial [Phormidesmis sp.]
PEGASADHKGVDLDTPEGTKVYAPGKLGDRVTVRCWTDSGGGGLVAEIESASFPNLWFQALHLSDCKTGIYRAGDDIARTGSSGIGAPHLDWRQRDRLTDQHQHPQKSYLLWALTGREPNANFTRIDILRNAIISQESGSNSAAVNPDSGAMGLGQVMPENLGGTGEGWDYDALGKDLTPEQFLADPDAQNKIINHQLSKTFEAQIAAGQSEDEAIRRTAATWYSGQADTADDATPQPYGSASYPSIKDYADEVLNRVHQLRLEQLDK